MILAARHLVRHRPALAADVGLLFVVGEETDHAGMIVSWVTVDGLW